MRILLSSHGASPFGAERVLLVLARGLLARGHEVVLEFPHDGPAVAEARSIDGVRVLVSDRPRLPRNRGEAMRYFFGALPAASRLAREIRAGGFDVVWVNSLFNPVAALAGRLARRRVVWHLHERNFRGPARIAGELAVLLGCHRAVAVSVFVASSFGGPRGRFRILRNVDFRRLPAQPPRSGEGFVVGYLGQLESRKRVEDVLEAASLLPEIRVLVVGDGKRREEVVTAVGRFGVRGRVELAGFQTDVARYLGMMDCVVLPARDEPCPLVAYEAMAAGVPVIASDHGSHREVLGDAAIYYPVANARALAAQIQLLRADPTFCDVLRARAHERVREADPERWLERAEAVALEVTGARAPLPELVHAGGRKA